MNPFQPKSKSSNCRKFFALFPFTFCFFLAVFQNNTWSSSDRSSWNTLEKIPVLHGGRIKPLDSFSRELVRLVTEGSSTLPLWRPGHQGPQTSLAFLMDYLVHPSDWASVKFVAIQSIETKQRLSLETQRKFFSPQEIIESPQLRPALMELRSKSQQGVKLTSQEQATLRVGYKLDALEGLSSGAALALNPVSTEEWQPLTTPSPVSQAFARVALSQEKPDFSQAIAELLEIQATALLKTYGRDFLPGLASHMNWETHFNSFHPFLWAWILYLSAAFVFFLGLKWKKVLPLAWALNIGGFLIHTYGFGLRCYLTGHPPVTNMYESTIWVPWAAILFSYAIAWIQRKSPRFEFIPLAASLMAGLAMILADHSPTILDPTIKPLEPVLRSNMWLTIHVLTITMSYGAFLLSLALGDLYLLLAWKESKLKKLTTSSLPSLFTFMYRAVQFGVVLLAAGTILGGVWADYSWGRFWGWDPKETWALIALLLYLVVLHGQWAGWLKKFHVVVLCVLCFLGVLMAWYGVNFVLGVGLHSYGFSSGGLGAVSTFVMAQILFIGFILYGIHRNKGDLSR